MIPSRHKWFIKLYNAATNTIRVALNQSSKFPQKAYIQEKNIGMMELFIDSCYWFTSDKFIGTRGVRWYFAWCSVKNESIWRGWVSYIDIIQVINCSFSGVRSLKKFRGQMCQNLPDILLQVVNDSMHCRQHFLSIIESFNYSNQEITKESLQQTGSHYCKIFD